jgi:hypothetical protein
MMSCSDGDKIMYNNVVDGLLIDSNVARKKGH